MVIVRLRVTVLRVPSVERVQEVLGAVVRAEQRLAWAKVVTRLGAGSRIRAEVEREHGRGLPRQVGEMLLVAAVSTSEVIIARSEMQVSEAQIPHLLHSPVGADMCAAMLLRRQSKPAAGSVRATGVCSLAFPRTGTVASETRSR